MSEKFHGNRGQNGMGGWWIDLKEAQNTTVGKEKWWLIEGLAGKVVPLRQHDSAGPSEKPIWFLLQW